MKKFIVPIAAAALLVSLSLLIPATYLRENAIAVSVGICLLWIGQRMRRHGV
jgi:hypothetical protein